MEDCPETSLNSNWNLKKYVFFIYQAELQFSFAPAYIFWTRLSLISHILWFLKGYQRLSKYGFGTINSNQTPLQSLEIFLSIRRHLSLTRPKEHIQLVSLWVISVALKLVSHHCDWDITEQEGRNQFIKETIDCRHKTNSKPKCSNVVESHNWIWITSFSSHTSRSWENMEGKDEKIHMYFSWAWSQALGIGFACLSLVSLLSVEKNAMTISSGKLVSMNHCVG